MALFETYVANLKNIPERNRIFVMRRRGNDNLAPPEDLFKDIKRRAAELEGEGFPGTEAHNRAWEDVRFEERFTEAILSNPEALLQLRQLKQKAESEDVYLICYEAPPKKCHRHVLLKLAANL